jgi:hypothetical protein
VVGESRPRGGEPLVRAARSSHGRDEVVEDRQPVLAVVGMPPAPRASTMTSAPLPWTGRRGPVLVFGFAVMTVAARHGAPVHHALAFGGSPLDARACSECQTTATPWQFDVPVVPST